ncbi:MAG: hypothetical protein ACJA2N_001912 [Salibacteraceae bacterium]|jgi:hypothetical protein
MKKLERINNWKIKTAQFFAIIIFSLIIKSTFAQSNCNLVVNAGCDRTVCEGNFIKLGSSPTASGGVQPYSYQWSHSTTLNDASVSNPEARPFNNTYYKLVVTDASGCMDSSFVSINVQASSPLLSNGGFSATGVDGRGQIDKSNWNPLFGTPDLFQSSNTCAPIACGATGDFNCVGIPCNHFGSRNARVLSDSNYAGLWAAVGAKVDGKVIVVPPRIHPAIYISPYTINPDKLETVGEAMGKALDAELIVGKKYQISLFTSVADKGELDSVTVADEVIVNVYLTNNKPIVFNPDLSNVTLVYTKKVKRHDWERHLFNYSPTKSGLKYMIIQVKLPNEWEVDADLESNSIHVPVIRHPIDTADSGFGIVTNAYVYFDDVEIYEQCSNIPPVADAGRDRSICPFQSVTIGGSPAGSCGNGNLSYSWTPTNNLSNPNISNPEASPTSTTIYTLVVTDSKGYQATDQVTIFISGAGLDAGEDRTICSGDTTIIGEPDSNPNWSYLWTPSIGLSDNEIPQPKAYPDVTSTYKLEITDNYGCIIEDWVTVNVNESPSVQIATFKNGNPLYVNLVCQQDNIEMLAQILNYQNAWGYEYSWKPDGVSTDLSDESIQIIAKETTLYIVTVNDKNSCSAKDSVNLLVFTADAGPNRVICEGTNSTNIGGNPSAKYGLEPYVYSWTPNDNTMNDNTLANPIVSPDETVYYFLSVTDANSCVAKDTVGVERGVLPIVIPHGGYNTSCYSPGKVFSVGSVAKPEIYGGKKPYTYKWTASNTNHILNDDTKRYCTATVGGPNLSTVFYLEVIDANGCIAASRDSVKITTTDPCNPCKNFTALAGGSKAICQGDMAELGGKPAAKCGTEPYFYQWTVKAGDFNSISGQSNLPNPIVSPTISTFYKLTVTDINGEIASDSVWVIVDYLSVSAAPSKGKICAGNTIKLSAGADGCFPPYTYSWSVVSGDATPNFTNQFEAQTDVTLDVTTRFRVTVTDNDNNISSTTFTVLVDYLGDIDAGNNKVLCIGSQTTLGGNPTANGCSPFSYTWNVIFGDPNSFISSNTSANPIVEPQENTLYELVVTKGGTAKKDRIFIEVNGPIITAGDDKYFCNDSVLIGYDAIGGKKPYSYSWSPTVGLGTPNASHTYAAPPMSMSYTLTVTDASGCSASDDVYIFSAAPPAYAGNDTVLCGTNDVCLGLLNTNPAYTYTWSPVTYLDPNPNVMNPCAIQVDSDIEYELVVAESGNECVSHDQVKITVKPAILPVNAGTDKTICKNDSVLIGELNPKPGYTYTWSPVNGIKNPTSPTTMASPSSTTTYTLTAGQDECSTSDDVVVTVIPGITALYIGPDISICEGLSVQIGNVQITGGQSPYTYTWSPSEGLNTTSGPVVTASPTVSTYYTLTLTDANGCQLKDSLLITVFQNINVVHNEDFELGGIPDGRNQIDSASEWYAASGTPDLFDERFTSCSPGPCDTTLLDMNCVGIPCNHFGNENNRTATAGNRYAGVWFALGDKNEMNFYLNSGIYIYGAPSVNLGDIVNSSLSSFKEAIGVPIDKLDPQKTYTMKLFVSKAEKGEADTLLNAEDAHFAIKMSTTKITNDNQLGLPNYSSVNADLIKTASTSKTNGWEEISFEFKPKKGYKYMVIESTYPDDLVERVIRERDSLNTNVGIESYMYIDDISIYEKCLPAIDPLVVDLEDSGNEVLCENPVPCNTYTVYTTTNPVVSGGTAPYTYSWFPSTGLSSTTVLNPFACPSQTTDYILTVTDDDGNVAKDTVTFKVPTVSNLSVDLGPDIYGCLNEGFWIYPTITGGTSPRTYLLNPASYHGWTTTRSFYLSINGDTKYTFTVTDANGCTAIDDFWLHERNFRKEIVNNGGFESGNIPSNRGEFGTATTDWIAATGDPELFDSRVNCRPLGTNSPNCVDLPANYFGNQAHNGVGRRYAGLGAIVDEEYFLVKTVDLKAKVEGIESKLKYAINPNSYYNLSFDVSVAEKGESQSQLSEEAQFSVKFSETLQQSQNLEAIDANLLYNGKSTNKYYWDHISINFKGNKAYKYLIIQSRIPDNIKSAFYGRFQTISVTDPLRDAKPYESYFYIDNVSIIELCNKPDSFSTIQSYSTSALVAEPEEEILKPEIGKQNEFKVYPNPAKHEFNVSGLNNNNKVIVYNLLGQEVFYSKKEIINGTLVFDSSLWLPGVYIIEVQENERPVYKSRISILQ